ncbi:hypothetical protein [Paraburkholderia sp. BCC1886]|uniref:hypothetical protein n=1 Tax=Paraburkholderia sp. BCC1886 TaxID=2562670 RepID=UPI00118273D1|nr:hypothetical protein [Paraburkholderia sp. BCC1886]
MFKNLMKFALDAAQDAEINDVIQDATKKPLISEDNLKAGAIGLGAAALTAGVIYGGVKGYEYLQDRKLKSKVEAGLEKMEKDLKNAAEAVAPTA